MMLNKPSPRLAILRAQLAAEADAIRIQRASYKISNAVGCSCPVPAPDADSLPLPPSYSEDLEQWLAQRESERVHEAVLERQRSARSVAPAKPAATGDAYVSAKQPEPAADVWHSEPPSMAGVYLTKPECSDMKVARARWWDGSEWHMNPEQRNAPSDKARSMPVRKGELFGKLQWLRLIEADAPAQQPAQKASTHSVCIRAYGPWKVGEIAWWNGAPQAIPANWLPCDESGWVTHVPTADAVCPVPAGVDFEFKVRDGELSYPGSKNGINAVNWDSGRSFICAWRPIAQS